MLADSALHQQRTIAERPIRKLELVTSPAVVEPQARGPDDGVRGHAGATRSDPRDHDAVADVAADAADTGLSGDRINLGPAL